MKLIVNEQMIGRIRDVIEETRKTLAENKTYRKNLYRQVAASKASIRKAEQIASTLQTAKSDPSYMRSHIKTINESLNNLRQEALSAEIFMAIERAKFRILHEQLDMLKIPFNPGAKRSV